MTRHEALQHILTPLPDGDLALFTTGTVLFATALTTFLAANNRVPGLIVVAIENTDRNRDLTTPTQNEVQGMSSGGADRFLQFLREELIPWTDDNYRTVPYRILLGHSLGGFFAIHALFSQPQTFDAYIAISPSVQWGDQHAVQHAETFLDATEQLNATLYMAVANEGGTLLSGMRRLAALFDERPRRGFRWAFEQLFIIGNYHYWNCQVKQVSLNVINKLVQINLQVCFVY
jgi:uncharacterized protein